MCLSTIGSYLLYEAIAIPTVTLLMYCLAKKGKVTYYQCLVVILTASSPSILSLAIIPLLLIKKWDIRYVMVSIVFMCLMLKLVF